MWLAKVCAWKNNYIFLNTSVSWNVHCFHLSKGLKILAGYIYNTNVRVSISNLHKSIENYPLFITYKVDELENKCNIFMMWTDGPDKPTVTHLLSSL